MNPIPEGVRRRAATARAATISLAAFAAGNAATLASTAGAAIISLAATTVGYAITAASFSGAEGPLEGILRPRNEFAFYLLWTLAGAIAGFVAIAVIVHQIRPARQGKLERALDHTAFPLAGAVSLLVSGVLGHLAARSAL